MPLEIPSLFPRKQCPHNCSEHTFHSVPHHSGKSMMKGEIKIDFCPITNEYACPVKVRFGRQNIVPILNNDGLQFLPGFILEIDKVHAARPISRSITRHT